MINWDKMLARHHRKEYQLGQLFQYSPRPLPQLPCLPECAETREKLRFCILTPSYQQGAYLERTLLSVLHQDYPNLAYGLQDGGSEDESKQILKRYEDKLFFALSETDSGQTDALIKGFRKLDPRPEDIMAWINSDDIYLPGVLNWINHFFLTHPEVDVVYGHRLIIDSSDQEVGRWYLPEYRPEVLKWVDFVPQETLFFRASAYQKVGGLDPSFHFAMDWDFILRLQSAGCRFERIPYFMGCFRLHHQQKTNYQIKTLGEKEMQRLRLRNLGRPWKEEEIEKIFWREVRRSRRTARNHCVQPVKMP